MYYISMYVTPHWKQSDCQKVKKALAQFWVNAKDSVTAARKAINYSEKHQCEVHSLKQIPTVIGYEDQTHGAIGLTHSHRAHEQGISMCLTDWDI
jgi:N-acetylglutamate synthase-like GNAT family acetyltransferase